MRYQSISKLQNSYWYSFSDEPVASLKGHLSKLSNPSFLLPEESPDGLWHLFADTYLGIEHYSSTSGLEWERAHLLFPYANSAFIYKEGSTYYIVYETHHRKLFKRSDEERKRTSRIMISSSTDLSLWSQPKEIFDSSAIREAVFRDGNERLSSPQLVQWNGRYRLYFGAGEAVIYDSNARAAASLMFAESDYIDGPYKAYPHPIFGIDRDSRYRSLAVGAVRIVPCSDGLAAVECAYSYSEESNRSETVMILCLSSDGIDFIDSRIIERTPEEGWASRYITGADLRYKESDDAWYCYFSASENVRMPWLKLRKESIGLLLGRDR